MERERERETLVSEVCGCMGDFWLCRFLFHSSLNLSVSCSSSLGPTSKTCATSLDPVMFVTKHTLPLHISLLKYLHAFWFPRSTRLQQRPMVCSEGNPWIRLPKCELLCTCLLVIWRFAVCAVHILCVGFNIFSLQPRD